MTAEWNGTQRELEILELRKEVARLQGAKRRALAVADERSKENVMLRDILKAIDHTLCVHGHIDAGTPLHQRIDSALVVPTAHQGTGQEP